MINSDPEKIIRAAKTIAEARKSNYVLEHIPLAIRPTSLDEAYSVQDALAEQLGWAESGWFCACVNPEIQQQLGLDQPYLGRAVTRHQFPSPATLSLRHYPPILLECEFAFRLKHDLPTRPDPYTQAEVLSAVASVHPVIEAVSGYLKDWINQDVYSVIADNGADGPIIYGSGIEDVSVIDFANIPVTLHINGQIERTGNSANVGGNPIKGFTWLVNTLSARGIDMKAGYLNNTGTSTALIQVAPGDRVIADFGMLGKVHLTTSD